MSKFKSYGCVLEDDEQFCNLWTRRQARSIWGEQQPKRKIEEWKTQSMAQPQYIGHSTRPLNFTAVPKDEPSRMLKFPRFRDRIKKAS